MSAASRFLLVDTSDRIALVGIYDGATTLAEVRADCGRPSLEWVTRSIDDVQKSAGASWEALDFLACGVGPGGFTSLRIGMSVLKAMGQSLNLPMVGVHRLEAAAMGQHLLDGRPGTARYWVRLPAAQNLEYAAMYRISESDTPVCLRKPSLLLPQKAASLNIPAAVVRVTVRPEIFHQGLPRAAWLKALKGRTESAAGILPLYLRGATLGPAGGALKAALSVARRRRAR